MIGVVIPIEDEAADRLRALWAALDGVLRQPPHEIPHLSLHVAAEYEQELVDRALRSVARSQAPFAVHVAGFGVFPGKEPVFHLVVSRSPRLTVLHRVVAQEVGRFASEPDPNFGSDRWVPHITLSRGPLTISAVAGAAERLAAGSFVFQLPVADLALLEDTAEGQRIIFRYPLEI